MPCGTLVTNVAVVPDSLTDTMSIGFTFTVNVIASGTPVTVHVPLYGERKPPTFCSVTPWPTASVCGEIVLIVAVVPTAVAPPGDAATVVMPVWNAGRTLRTFLFARPSSLQCTPASVEM